MKHVLISGAWPLLHRGISFWQGRKANHQGQIYLLGNPLVWIGSTLCMVVFVALMGCLALGQQRKMNLTVHRMS